MKIVSNFETAPPVKKHIHYQVFRWFFTKETGKTGDLAQNLSCAESLWYITFTFWRKDWWEFSTRCCCSIICPTKSGNLECNIKFIPNNVLIFPPTQSILCITNILGHNNIFSFRNQTATSDQLTFEYSPRFC